MWQFLAKYAFAIDIPFLDLRDCSRNWNVQKCHLMNRMQLNGMSMASTYPVRVDGCIDEHFSHNKTIISWRENENVTAIGIGCFFPPLGVVERHWLCCYVVLKRVFGDVHTLHILTIDDIFVWWSLSKSKHRKSNITATMWEIARDAFETSVAHRVIELKTFDILYCGLFLILLLLVL